MPKRTLTNPGANPGANRATNPGKPAPRTGAAQKIRQGKVELSDEELTRVSGGQSNKRIILIE